MDEKEIREYIRGVLSGKYSAENLPQQVFDYTSNELIAAFESGWGSRQITDPDIYSPDLEMFNSFRNNLWYFAGNKTAAQVNELQALMYDEKGNRRSEFDFTKDALKLDNTFNRRYIQAEYDATFKLAHSGREWRDIENTKDIFPILEWVAVMDANTRHGEFNGIRLLVDDPWWDTHPIPFEWGCRCRRRQLREGTLTDQSKIADIPEGPKLFRHNVYKSKQVWNNEEHPYGKKLTKEQRKGVSKLVRQAAINFPMRTLRETQRGGILKAHPLHVFNRNKQNAQELEMNISLGEQLAEQGHQVELLPEIQQSGKNPDVRIDGTIGEFKRPASYTAIQSRLRKANRQGAKIVVLEIESGTVGHEEVYRSIKGSFDRDGLEAVNEVWVNLNGQLVKTGRKVQDGFLEELEKVESTNP